MSEQTTKIMLKNVRISYVNVFEPKAVAGSNAAPKYSCSVLIPKTDQATLQSVNNAMREAFTQGLSKRWGGKQPAILKNPLRDGDTKDAEKNPEYVGMMFINASNVTKPIVVDRQRNEITDPSELYSGCYANVLLNFFPYSKAGNNGVGASLLGVQFVSEGERLAGGASVSEFAQLDGADSMDDGLPF